MLTLLLSVAIASTFQAKPVASDCVKFTSGGRLHEGQRFGQALPGGLEFRLRPTGGGWDIEVVDPATPTTDYMWVVSPPYQTAPQRQIGGGYNLTARQSAGFERQVRFVLNSADHKRIFDAHAKRLLTEQIVAILESLPRGTLRLRITEFSIGQADAFAWITFEGEACVPR